MRLNGKLVDLPLLRDELAAAGIQVPALGTSGDELVTYDAEGAIVGLPPEAAAVLAAHNVSLSAASLHRGSVLTLAQSCVGVRLQDLTAAQVKALLATVLFKLGAIGTDLTVKPLDEWV